MGKPKSVGRAVGVRGESGVGGGGGRRRDGGAGRHVNHILGVVSGEEGLVWDMAGRKNGVRGEGGGAGRQAAGAAGKNLNQDRTRKSLGRRVGVNGQGGGGKVRAKGLAGAEQTSPLLGMN